MGSQFGLIYLSHQIKSGILHETWTTTRMMGASTVFFVFSNPGLQQIFHFAVTET